MPILFLLGVSGQSPHTPDQNKTDTVAKRHITLARGMEAGKAETHDPASGISRGSVHDSPTGNAGRALA
jgi:hypothetical protein